MRKYLFLLIVLFPGLSNSQSLSSKRVDKIKSATVRVKVEDGISTGTGFFVGPNGSCVTCWHVIQPALVNNKRIFIEFNNGDTLEMKVENSLISNMSAVAYDYCVLLPLHQISYKTSYLKFGDFGKLNEGQEIYTCGYPLGYPQQFISRGIVSSKYLNKNWGVADNNGFITTMPRDEALLDLTLNVGNSGGAIVKVGTTIDDDEVIGVADFIINPLGNIADQIIKSYYPNIGTVVFNAQIDSAGRVVGGNDPNKTSAIFAQAIGSMSIGVSGCVSANYPREFLKELMKRYRL